MAEAVLESLASRLMELDGLIEERDRHVEISEEDTSNLIKHMENSNTRRKTEYDTKLFCDWLVGVDEQRRLIDIPPGELDILLSRFFMSARKADGSNYEPDSLKCIQNSLCRYLKQNNYQKNINQDIEFDHSRRVMDARRKELKQAGLGNKKQKAEAFSDEEINILYQKNLLGKGNPESLLNTVFMNNTMHFGLRGRQEHLHLLWGDISLEKTSTGTEYLLYNERATKTRSGITGSTRKFEPKIFATPGDIRCPVEVYKQYRSQRPDEMLVPEAKFYLSINHQRRGSNSLWYKKSAMGKNTLGQLVKTMSEKGELEGRKVNHSVRKTAIRSLIHAGVSHNHVAQLSGHRNLKSLDDYSSASEKQQQEMSNILSRPAHPQQSASNCTTDIIENNEHYEINDIPTEDMQLSTCNPGSGPLEATVIDLPLISSPGGTLSYSSKQSMAKQSFRTFFQNAVFHDKVNISMCQCSKTGKRKHVDSDSD